MKIGNFKKTDHGTFLGTIQTLTLNKEIELVPFDQKSKKKAPDFQIFHTVNNAEIGAGWNKKSKATGNPYINIKIDDPAFKAPLWCALTQNDAGDYNLFWTRSEASSKAQSPADQDTL